MNQSQKESITLSNTQTATKKESSNKNKKECSILSSNKNKKHKSKILHDIKSLSRLPDNAKLIVNFKETGCCQLYETNAETYICKVILTWVSQSPYYFSIPKDKMNRQYQLDEETFNRVTQVIGQTSLHIVSRSQSDPIYSGIDTIWFAVVGWALTSVSYLYQKQCDKEAFNEVDKEIFSCANTLMRDFTIELQNVERKTANQ